MLYKNILKMFVVKLGFTNGGAGGEKQTGPTPEKSGGLSYMDAIVLVKQATQGELMDVLPPEQTRNLTAKQLSNLKQYLDLKTQCEELTGGEACGDLEINLSESDQAELNVSGYAFESEFFDEYLSIANGDEEKARIFERGEQEIRNNPKVKPKRLERSVKVYLYSLKELFDGDGKYNGATEKFLKKYTPDTYKELLELEGDLRNINDLNIAIEAENKKQEAENKKQEAENKKQARLKRIQAKLDELTKKLGSLQ